MLLHLLHLFISILEWDKCLAEGVTIKFPKELCRLVAHICVFGLPLYAVKLWCKYKENEDLFSHANSRVFSLLIPTCIEMQKGIFLMN